MSSSPSWKSVRRVRRSDARCSRLVVVDDERSRWARFGSRDGRQLGDSSRIGARFPSARARRRPPRPRDGEHREVRMAPRPFARAASRGGRPRPRARARPPPRRRPIAMTTMASLPIRRGLVLGGASLAPRSRRPHPFAERAVAAEELTQVSRRGRPVFVQGPQDGRRRWGTPRGSRSSRAVGVLSPGDPDVNVNVVATALRADYQRMGSFGSADDFAFGVAAGMTRFKPRWA